MYRVKKFLDELTVNKDFLHIIQPFSIGDFIYAGGLAHAAQKKKNKQATVLIVNERMKNLGITYSNFANIVFLPGEAMEALKQYFYVTGNYEGGNYIYGHFHAGKNGGYIWDDTLHLIDRYKKNIFDIPMNTEFVPPVVPAVSEQNIVRLNKKYILDKFHTVIILPYVHSTRQLDIKFWELLAEKLKAQGHVVYTNTNGFSEKPVAGTNAISTNLREMYFISDKIKCFIGSRNGIFDFLALTKATIMNINPFPEWLWDISLMYPNSKNRTFYNAVEYVKPIADYLGKSKVNAQINLSHSKIRPTDIFYSYEDILNSILTDAEKI